MLLTVFAGFARSFFLRPWFPDHPSPPETAFYWHGAVFAAWFLLLLAQPLLRGFDAGGGVLRRPWRWRFRLRPGRLKACLASQLPQRRLGGQRRVLQYEGVAVPAALGGQHPGPHQQTGNGSEQVSHPLFRRCAANRGFNSFKTKGFDFGLPLWYHKC